MNFLPVRTSKVMFFNMLSWVPIGKTMPLRRPESRKRVFHEPAGRHATKMSFLTLPKYGRSPTNAIDQLCRGVMNIFIEKIKKRLV